MKLPITLILFLCIGATVVANKGPSHTVVQSDTLTDWRTFALTALSGDGRHHPLHFTEDDLYYITEAIYFEAATESQECQQLVAEVILNRRSDNRWAKTVKGVVWQKYQFSYTHDGKSEQMLDLGARRRIERLAVRVLGGHVVDSSKGSLYYYNPDLANPDWDWSKIEKVLKCDSHDFYRDLRAVVIESAH